MLVRRGPELMANVNRMLQRPVSAPLCEHRRPAARGRELGRARAVACSRGSARCRGLSHRRARRGGLETKALPTVQLREPRARGRSSMQLRLDDSRSGDARGSSSRSSTCRPRSRHRNEAGLLRKTAARTEPRATRALRRAETLLLRTGGGVPLGPLSSVRNLAWAHPRNGPTRLSCEHIADA